MVTRKRVSLSLSESDFLHLCELAKIDGKLPTSLASDLLKSALFSRPIKTAFKASVSRSDVKVPSSLEKSPEPSFCPSVAVLSRRERRALDRSAKKKK